MKPQLFDPKLRQAVAEIREICKKYDIGGHVVLASSSHVEFALMIEEPSWSVVKFEPEKGAIRFSYRPKSDPQGKKKGEATAGMLFGIRDQLANGYLAMDDISKQLSKVLDIEHDCKIGKPPASTPYDLPEH